MAMAIPPLLRQSPEATAGALCFLLFLIPSQGAYTFNIIQMSGLVPHFSPAIGSAVLLSMGYIDIGKWAATIEGGPLFGPSLALLLFFNCSAILCQHLANCIGLVSGKNLAQICCEEYPRSTCILLGILAELSVIVSDLTKILGVAHVFNQLFELDLFSCICFSATVALLVPLFSPLGSYMLNVLYVSISAFTLLSYVLAVLLSQPEASAIAHNRHCGLDLETACGIMSLLGAHIMPHNFYIHSFIAQQHRRQLKVGLDGLIQRHLFATVVSFSAIFLVNYAIMNSAASVFNSYGFMPSFEDAFLLMDQIFRNSAAPFPLSLFFLVSSLITALTITRDTQVVLQDFFLISLPIWVHHIIGKVLATIPALYCTHIAGSEGIYQLLLSCQVISAILLLPSVIPLFRMSSSRFIMGSYKISSTVELFRLLVFLGMLASNIIFITLLLFGNIDWIDNLRGNLDNDTTYFYACVLFVTFNSLGFMIYLLVTPLRSSSHELDMERDTLMLNKRQIEQSESRAENDWVSISDNENHKSEANLILQDLLDSHAVCSAVETCSLEPKTIVDISQSARESDLLQNSTMSYIPQPVQSVIEDVIADDAEDLIFQPNKIFLEPSVEYVRMEKYLLSQNDQLVGSSEPIDSSTISVSEVKRKSVADCKTVCDGSQKEATSVLGPAGRRQLAAILDAFWGLLFDYHGKQTNEARGIIAVALLDLDYEQTNPDANAGQVSDHRSQLIPESNSVHPITSGGCNSSPLPQTVTNAESPCLVNTVAPVRQPTAHGVETIIYDRVFSFKRNSDSLEPSLSPTGASFTESEDYVVFSVHRKGSGPSCGNGLKDPVEYQVLRKFSPEHVENNSVSSNNFTLNDSRDGQCPHIDSKVELKSLAYDNNSEHKLCLNNIFRPIHVTLSFDEVWTKVEYSRAATKTWGGKKLYSTSGGQITFISYGKGERLVLHSLRVCIRKLLRLDRSEWLFSQGGGSEEKLIDYFAETERILMNHNPRELDEDLRDRAGEPIMILPTVPNCSQDCIWQAGLIACFGVWCIRRILELLLVESRPELWGKYTYVLNRLQGIIEPAFRKERREKIFPCRCLHLPVPFSSTEDCPFGTPLTTSTYILDLIKKVETSISGRKGRAGTGAGKVAFPQGKKNLGSVLNRYKRRLTKCLVPKEDPTWEALFEHPN